MFWGGAMKHYKNHIAVILVCMFLPPAASLQAASPSGSAPGAGGSAEGEASAKENAEPAEMRLSEAENTVSRYQTQLRKLEAENGVYNPAMAETLLSLGMAYKDMDNHNEATETFKRGLQISRINNGLQSLEQLPYLEFLIQENQATGDWEAVNDNIHYLFWLYKRNYGDNDPRLLPVIERVTRSQAVIFNSSPDLFTIDNLEQREEMQNLAIEIIETHYGENDPRLINAYNELAVTQYYMAVQTGYLNAYRKYARFLKLNKPFKTITTAVAVPIATPLGTAYIVRPVEMLDFSQSSGVIYNTEVQKKMDLIQQTDVAGYIALRKIEKLHDQNAQLSAYSRALALTHEGDWRLLYNSGKGLKQYRQAQALLDQTADGRQYIQHLFGQPRPLPAFLSETEGSLTTAPATEETQEQPDQDYLEVAYDVTSAGYAVNVHVINRPAGVDDAVIKRVKRHLSNLRFRPRFENADPVRTEGLKVKYSVDAKGQIVAEAE